MINRLLVRLRRIPLELTFWISGLTYLFLLNVERTIPAPRLCFSALIGPGTCPGCGLGESISLLLGGQITEALDAHILGPLALIVILHRIYTLLRTQTTINRKEHSHGETHATAP
ncbi:MAG: DUF2752 domain-containing protein [Ignavibacteria bacterium]|nr:DUF2752 domain-containing protein [Ignavibacteria bacterium]